MSKKIISVVIPCRNQEKKIGETIDHIKKTADRLDGFEIEIVFVNDRSTDKSAEIATKHLADYKNSQILHTDESYVGNGKGLAVELGMTKSSGEYRIFMDADNSTKFEEITKLIPYFDKYDIVLGTRYSNAVVVPSGNWFKSFWLAVVDVVQVIIYGHAKRYTAKMKQGRLREFVSRGANLAFTVLLGQSFTDSRCGFKMYSKEASEKIFPLCQIKTWDFDSEALVLAKRFGYSMVEVPVVWYDDAGASNFKIKDMINGFTSIFAIRWYQLRGKYGKAKRKGKRGVGFLALALVVGALTAFYLQSCKISDDLKAYIIGKENTYILSKSYCVSTNKIKRTSESNISKLPKTGKFEVLMIVDTPEIEKELAKYYSTYNKLIASGSKEKFIIYEVTCASCSQ